MQARITGASGAAVVGLVRTAAAWSDRCHGLSQVGRPRNCLPVAPDCQDTLQGAVRKNSFLVHDGWTSTQAAVEQLGYKHAPAVKHDEGYRDVETGFHTNDAESENSRVKGWNRHRYGKLMVTKEEMDEYVFYVNVGEGIGDVMKGLAYANGGVVKNDLL